jgi:hypothetical protein
MGQGNELKDRFVDLQVFLPWGRLLDEGTDPAEMSWFANIKVLLRRFVDRWSKEHLIAFVEIAFISILSRRLKRLVVKELSA